MSFFRPLIQPHLLGIADKPAPALTVETETPIHTCANLNENRLTRDWLPSSYADAQDPKLKGQLSKLYEVPEDHIFLTPGADEAINYLSLLFCDENSSVMTHSPTYWTYTRCAMRFRAAVEDVTLQELENDFELQTQKMIQQINNPNKKLKVVYICNPNNPTGSYFDPNQIHDIIKAAETKGIAAVVDEAYIEISGQPSILKNQEQYPNLIVLRSLSKAYSLAGERVGAIICSDPELMKALPVVEPMKALTINAIHNAREMTSAGFRNVVRESWDTIHTEREILRDALNQAKGARAFKSATNFILIGVKNAQKAFKDFTEKGILPTNPALFNFEGYSEEYVRFSLGTLEDNKDILETIQAMDFSS